MNKILVAINHVKARESIGMKYTFLQKCVGIFKMMFLNSNEIQAATDNINAGNVTYKNGVVFVK